jgi:hypothetical protein
VKERLVSRGFGLAERIPAVDAQIVVFRSDDLPRVQRGFRLLDTLGYWLPFVCVTLVGAGILLARDRRRALVVTGAGFALAMLVTGLAQTAAREAYLRGVPPEQLPPDAAAALYDTLVRFLRDGIRAGALIGILVALLAFLAGPSTAAVLVRRLGRDGLGTAKGGVAALGLDLDPVTGWVAPRVKWLRAAVLAVAFAVLLLQRYRTPEFVGWVAVVTVLALLVVEFLAAEPRRPEPKAPPEAAAARAAGPPGATA